MLRHILCNVLRRVCTCCPHSYLPPFQQFLLVLMKLHLNLFDSDLAYRFRISQATVSRSLLRWPAREQLHLTLPTEFRNCFKKSVALIYCFEVFCERHKSLRARAQTWSNYKHHNTIKFLIAITPQGTITFVSKGWDGHASDQHIAENCGVQYFSTYMYYLEIKY